MAIDINKATIFDLTDDMQLISRATSLDVESLAFLKKSGQTEISRVVTLEQVASELGMKAVVEQLQPLLDGAFNE